MTKQFAIAARDHGAGIREEVGHDVAGGGGLPFVTGEFADAQDHLGDLLLGCSGAMSIDRLQHAPRAGQLLTREARIGWNGAAVKGGEQPSDGFHAIEPLHAKRDHRYERRLCRSVSGKRQVQALAVSQFMQDMRAVFGRYLSEGRAIRSDGCWRRRQYNRSGIFLRKPEHLRLGGLESWGDREIAAPTVYRRVRSAMVTREVRRNRADNPRSDATIPNRYRGQ
ncbi:hypothetical protein H4W01_002409 [Sphingomonas sp. PL20]